MAQAALLVAIEGVPLCGELATIGVKKPAVVVVGGYHVIIGLLARICGVPVVLCEQNAHPGRTNRLLARRAVVSLVHFDEARSLQRSGSRVIVGGNPVRGFAPRPRAVATPLRLLVMGGSLAATTLNQVMAELAPRLAADGRWHVVHLAGREHADSVRAMYAAADCPATVHGFIYDMQPIYNDADLLMPRRCDLGGGMLPRRFGCVVCLAVGGRRSSKRQCAGGSSDWRRRGAGARRAFDQEHPNGAVALG